MQCGERNGRNCVTLKAVDNRNVKFADLQLFHGFSKLYENEKFLVTYFCNSDHP